MLSINTNLSSLITQRSMKQSTNKLNQTIEHMTTGFKINHAKDNAANYNIATNMTTKIGSLDVAADNVAMGMDLVTTASDTIALMQNKAERLRALCTQARNGTYGAQSLAAINTEANAIMAEIDRIYSTAQYNGVALFTGGTESAAATPTVAAFAISRAATTENCFIVDPITYSDEEVAAMTTMTELVNGATSATKKYSISSKEELVALANYVNSGNDTTGMTFVLGADIDLGAYCDQEIANGNGGWTPIGNYSNGHQYFNCTFDGNGHVIKNLKIDRSGEYQGLFGKTNTRAKIKNLGIEGGYITGYYAVGGLVGYTEGSISNCYTTAIVNGTNAIGGLTGYAASSSSITNSYASGNVTGTGSYIGGLVGDSHSTISNSYATGIVNGSKYVGGLIGYAERTGCSVSNSYATGEVVGIDKYIGGLVGFCDASSITNSYAIGSVTGPYMIGGLCGSIGNNSQFNTVLIENCYATGNVSGTSYYVGGFTGRMSASSIKNCYATGTANGTKYVGGFTGDLASNVVISNCYAAGNVSGTSSSVGGFASSYNVDYSTWNDIASVQTDKKAQQMTEEKIKAVYTLDSMGFTDANGWTIVNDIPLLSWQTTSYAGNTGSSGSGAGGSGGTPTPDPDPDPDPDPTPDPDPDMGGTSGSVGGGSDSIGVSSFSLQIGINGDSSCQIGFDTNFTYDLSTIGADISSDEALATIDDFINLLSGKQTLLGAVQNRLESALDSIEVSMNNLISSRSTLRDADIADVSSTYIKQQILQQASATLLATANQSPSIALQLI